MGKTLTGRNGAVNPPHSDYEHLPSTAADAKKLGLRFYFSGKPCKNGHTAKRYASNLICVECQVINNAKWKGDNPDYHRLKKAEWRSANPGEHALKARNYRSRNGDKVRATERLHRQRFPEKKSIKDANRRALRMGSIERHTSDDVDRIIQAQNFRCACCGISVKSRESRHVDHITPLAKGGSNGPSNLQILCVRCNLSKGDRHPADFMRARGFLL